MELDGTTGEKYGGIPGMQAALIWITVVGSPEAAEIRSHIPELL